MTISPALMDAGEGIDEENIEEFDLVELAEAPVEVTEDPKTRTIVARILANPRVRRATLAGAGGLTTLAALARPVAAETINFTPIQEMIDGVAGLMPSVSTLVTAVVPVIILLVIVGFLTGLLDGIIDAVRGGFKAFKK